ncbi:MAG: radical SAM protein [Candidatus Eremiobacteraeota bacterium]|nr:radical SAM protein [Candidatus Eremiobacteraeota bacterium]
MKILLIAQDIDHGTFFSEMAVPLGLCYLASYVRHHLNEELAFTIINGDEAFRPGDYDLIGISSMSFHFPRAAAKAERIRREAGVPVILGGPHISALPRTLPGCFDAGVIGEGEQTFLELVSLVLQEGRFTAASLEKIKGIAYHHEGRVTLTPPRLLIEDMGTIPRPDRRLWDLSGKMKQIFSGRGCPCRCRFCAMPDSHYRKFPLDSVISELLFLRSEYQTGAVLFQDEILSMKKQWLCDLLGRMKEHNLHREMAYFVSSRADIIDEEMADIYREMNVKCVFIGIESGSEKILRYLKSGNMPIRTVQRALDLLAARDIQVEGSFIIGSPDESPGDMKETYEFIYENHRSGKLDMVSVFALVPFPGSAVWDEAMERGIVSEDMDWSRLTSMPIFQFDPERYLYLNRKMPREEFTEIVSLFRQLMATVCSRGIARFRKNILDPMGVKDLVPEQG